ncbi:hypothetical protein [Leifsonia sp. Leaf264]|uniref:hypothetical protein n=1 Tax=Leifsonia sp. Leaf264 TaxID=1736314 RepID=UPI0006F4304C|nr:hypothetical protein [Leifsonia sp. Leaf264]KQO98836.1 hypothetical protein ASF30_12295 [Leifsonia sp. Leaf264]
MKLPEKLFGRAARSAAAGSHAGAVSPRRRIVRTITAIAAVVAVISGGALTAITVQAASNGPHSSTVTPYGGDLGAYGTGSWGWAYCIDPVNDWPSGATGGPNLSSGHLDGRGTTSRYLGSDDTRKLNYILNRWGQENGAAMANSTAAAVSASVYNLTSLNDHRGSASNPDGRFWSNGDGAIQADVDWIWAETLANYNYQIPDGYGQITFAVDGNNNYNGTITVKNTPANTKAGTVTLTNGRFKGAGATRTDIKPGVAYAITGVPPTGASSYKISATGTFQSNAGTTADSVNVYYSDADQQRIVNGTGAEYQSFKISGTDPVNRQVNFEPTVTTSVPTAYLKAGQNFADTVTFGVKNGTTWATNGGNFIVLKAKGTLYGPFSTKPTQSTTVPASALSKVAGTATVTTTAADGPNISYSAIARDPGTGAAIKTVAGTGYYTWVWKVAEADQTTLVKNFLPDGYVDQDAFGLTAETPFVIPSFSTNATVQATPGSTMKDTVTITGVVPAQGIDVTFKAYLQKPGATTPACVDTGTGKTLLYTSPKKFLAAGTTPQKLTTDPFGLTKAHVGKIYWVATANLGGTTTQFWKDGCGTDPDETTIVSVPTFKTDATDQSAPGSTASDTITVTGFISPEGVDVTWAAYVQPAGFTTATCTTANLAVWPGVTPGTQHFTTAGTKSSNATNLDMSHVGVLVWVATAKVGTVEVWKDGCGTDPDERTAVKVPTFKTVATTESTPGSTAVDTANVNGFIPAEKVFLSWEAFVQPDGYTTPICTAANSVLKSAAWTPVTASGDVQSEVFHLDMRHQGTLLWVASARIGTVPVWQDGCGTDPNEQTKVSVPKFKTDALDQSTPGSTVFDSATVSGFIPAEGVDVTWAGYVQPAGYTTPVCDVTTAGAGLTNASAVHLTTAGEARSDDFKLDMSHAGTILWVATGSINGVQVWQDGCGTDPDETTIVSVPNVVTDALDQSVPGSTVTDTATVTGFLRPEGIDITFEGFRQDPNGDGTPVCAPENRVYNSTAPTHLTEAGEAKSEAFKVVMSDVGDGFTESTILWVATAKIGDVEIWKDVCGQNPDEASKLSVPKVSTNAEPFATPFSTVRDNAKVEGFLPPEGVDIQFNAYLQPAAADEDTDAEAAPVCTADNRVLQSTKTHHLDMEGDVTSEDFAVKATDVGTIFWQEVATVNDTVIHTGECGQKDEITSVQWPTFATEAAQGYIGEDAYDTATVTGIVAPGSYLTFDAYLAPQGEELVQDEAHLFNASWHEQKFPVNGEGVSKVGQESNDQVITVKSAGQLVTQLGKVQWVATLHAADGTVISAGDFTDFHERTTLKRSRIKGLMDVIEYSGVSVKLIYGGILAGTLLSIAFLVAAMVLWIRRRRTA